MNIYDVWAFYIVVFLACALVCVLGFIERRNVKKAEKKLATEVHERLKNE